MHVKLTCLAMTLALPLGAMATNWTGTESEDWFDSANWSDGVPNASTNSVRINTATPNPTLIEVGQAFTGTGLGIGHSGPGELMISSGASLESISASIGNQLAGQGLVVITGSNTSWATTGTTTFDIGHFGSGELEIVQGAKVYTGGDSGVGRNSGAFGKVLVVGTGSSWEVDGWIRVGWVGTGEMEIRDGGTVEFFSQTAASTLGQGNNGQGEVLVTGAGSKLTGGVGLRIGGSGAGTLRLTDGGTLELPALTSASGLLTIGANATDDSVGLLIVGAPSGNAPTSPGHLALARELHFGSGTGTAVFNHTGTLNLDFPVTGPTSSRPALMHFQNGSTLFDGEPASYGGEVIIEATARFGASGALGDTINLGILVANPGQASILDIQGDYTHGPDAVLEIQFAPGPSLDLVNISGEANLQGGSVRVNFLPGNHGSQPIDGLYPILSAAEGLSGQFSGVIDANQNAFQLVHGGDTVYLQVSDQLHRDRYELEP